MEWQAFTDLGVAGVSIGAVILIVRLWATLSNKVLTLFSNHLHEDAVTKEKLAEALTELRIGCAETRSDWRDSRPSSSAEGDSTGNSETGSDRGLA